MIWFLIAAAVIVLAITASLIWLRRTAMTPAEATAYLRTLGVDLVRLPGRLRGLTADPRMPRRARWWLVGLAVYIASPIDPIPDFIPVIGYLDELILAPLILRHIRRMIPDELWFEYFPPKHHD